MRKVLALDLRVQQVLSEQLFKKNKSNEKHKLWYQGPMFRYERPQKGRFRQFHQVGVEYLGFEEGIAEYELISMVLQINELMGISDYTIKINHLGDMLAKENFCNSLVSFLSLILMNCMKKIRQD